MGITSSSHSISKRIFGGGGGGNGKVDLQLDYNLYGGNINITSNNDYIDVIFEHEDDPIIPTTPPIRPISKKDNQKTINELDINNNVNNNQQQQKQQQQQQQYNNSNSNNNNNNNNFENYKFYNWKSIEIKSNDDTDNVNNNIPSSRYAHTMVSIDKELYVFGGYQQSTGKYLNDIHIFNTENNEWRLGKTTGTPPIGRAFHSSWCYDKKLYILAGFNGTVILDDLHTLDSRNMTWKKETQHSFGGGHSIPRSRFEHGTVLVGNEIYLFGGASQFAWLNDVHILNLDTNTWRYVNLSGEAPSKRCAHSMASNGSSYIFVFGGYTGSLRLNDLYILDCQRKRWILVSSQNNKLPGRAAAPMVMYKNNVLLIGGYDGTEKKIDVVSFDFTRLEWTNSYIIGPPPQSRSYHAAATVQDKIYIFGGYGQNSSQLNDICILEPVIPTLTDQCILRLLTSTTPNTTMIDRLPEGLKDLIKSRNIIKNLYSSQISM